MWKWINKLLKIKDFVILSSIYFTDWQLYTFYCLWNSHTNVPRSHSSPTTEWNTFLFYLVSDVRLGRLRTSSTKSSCHGMANCVPYSRADCHSSGSGCHLGEHTRLSGCCSWGTYCRWRSLHRNWSMGGSRCRPGHRWWCVAVKQIAKRQKNKIRTVKQPFIIITSLISTNVMPKIDWKLKNIGGEKKMR